MAKWTVTKAESMDIDALSKLPNADLKQIVRAYQKSVSQRKKRLEKSGVGSPWGHFLERHGAPGVTNPKTGKGYDTVGLINQIAKGRKLLGMETGTVQGARSFMENLTQRIPTAFEGKHEWPEEFQDYFWRVYDKYAQSHRAELMRNRGSDDIRRAVQIAIVQNGMIDPEAQLSKIEAIIDAEEENLYNSDASTFEEYSEVVADWYAEQLELARKEREEREARRSNKRRK